MSREVNKILSIEAKIELFEIQVLWICYKTIIIRFKKIIRLNFFVNLHYCD